jgi:hypothetical protein
VLAAVLPSTASTAEPQRPALIGAAPSAVASEVSVAALLFDLERIVAAAGNAGWLLEEVAQNEIHRDVMESVCRASDVVRAHALQRLEQQRDAAGDARALYARAGAELTSEVEAALAASRRLVALQRATDAAAQCPFWVQRDPEFHGLQSTRDRWIVNFDTGGTAQLRQTAGEWTVGAGGFGRLLGGYTFTRLSLLAGIEFGGGALVEPNTRPTAFAVNYIPALPVILRWHRDAWHVDLEAASVALFQASDLHLSYGVRAGVTIGVSALRVRGILPWVGIGAASEYHFENSVRPEAWYLRGGLRVGGVWDP